MKRQFLKACGVAAAGLLLDACGGGGSSASSGGSGGGGTSGSLLQQLQQQARFTALLTAVQKAGLEATLDGNGANLTLFAPENSAFDALATRIGKGDRDGLLAALSNQQWADILNFHVVAQRLSLANLTVFAASNERPTTLYSFNGDLARLIFVDTNGALHIWDGIGRSSITLTSADGSAANGVLHGVSDVLLPRGVLTVSQMLRASIDTFSNFGASMTPAVIAEFDGSGPFTVFAPGNSAVTQPLSATAVRHHAISPLRLGSDSFPSSVVLTPLTGQQVTLRSSAGPTLATLSYGTALQASVTDVDFFASNGVIHTIDRVLP